MNGDEMASICIVLVGAILINVASSELVTNQSLAESNPNIKLTEPIVLNSTLVDHHNHNHDTAPERDSVEPVLERGSIEPLVDRVTHESLLDRSSHELLLDRASHEPTLERTPIELPISNQTSLEPAINTTTLPESAPNNKTTSQNETFPHYAVVPDDNPKVVPAATIQPSQAQPVANITPVVGPTPADRRHQLLKPKLKFKCSQESDCNSGTCIRGTCYCEPGFSGESCAINIDECLQSGEEPCSNNGTCIDDINGFKCECLPGFRGETCQEVADMCNDSPCLNNALCINHHTNYTCECRPGWEGRHCEIDTDDCLKNPCKNDATCHDLLNGVRCDCQPGWEGKYCEMDIDECNTMNPCKNSAICRDLDGGYKCECQLGFEGINCEINIDDCAKSMCQNNSTCRDLINDYECSCEPGFKGKDCEENIDECASEPCRHGICTDLIDAYKCKCHDGYMGVNCDTDINECNNDRPVCQNGATCHNTQGSYECNCREGFTGKECASISDICKAKQPCKNGGNCKTLTSQKFRCECHSGYLGNNCERKRTCDPHECSSDHAHCVSNLTCACLPGRREERTMCEYVTSCEQVEGDLCLHGGKCTNLEQGGYHCNCEDPYFGNVCQYRGEPPFDAILLVVITCVGFLLAACAVVSLVIFRSVRKARATRGTYSPSTQEKFGNSASDLLKPPVPERLI